MLELADYLGVYGLGMETPDTATRKASETRVSCTGT